METTSLRPVGDPVGCIKLVETIHDQVRFLRSAVERGVELRQQTSAATRGNSADETVELTEQIIKLKAMLSAKREQVT